MREIRSLPEKDYPRFLEIAANAYPRTPYTSEQDKESVLGDLTKRLTDIRTSLHGMYDNDKLLAGIMLDDYKMTIRTAHVLAGGGGSLAVDLLHKKEHIARDLMRFFFEYYQAKQSPIAVLWSFRPDFYRRMGVGLGGNSYTYELQPDQLPIGSNKEKCKMLTKDDLPALSSFYNTVVSKTTGMIEQPLYELERVFDGAKNTRYVGYFENNKVTGYLAFTFKPKSPDNFLNNQMYVYELLYEGSAALGGLMAFLHSQADQIHSIILQTHEPDFHHLLIDPRRPDGAVMRSVYHDTCMVGTGMMYRILDIPVLFEALKDYRFESVDFEVTLDIKDTFLPQTGGQFGLSVKDGKATIKIDAKYDTTLSMDIADFSSLVMGAVNLNALIRYGRATLPDASQQDTLHRFFATDQQPFCMTAF